MVFLEEGVVALKIRMYGLVAALVLAQSPLCLSQIASSDSYSMDYAEVAAGGSNAQTTDYQVVDLVKVEGVEGAAAASTNYSSEPVVGSADAAPNTGVSDWMLY